MNIIFEKITDNYTLKLAEFNEDPEILFNRIKNDLSLDEKNYFATIKNNKRKCEWSFTRILLKTIFKTYKRIYYDDVGNPYLHDDLNISITHSGNIVGIIVSKNKNTGIDVEIISDRILKTAHKFILKEELDLFPESTKLKNIYLRWCGKETLFKIKGGGGYDFKKDFILKPFKINHKGDLTALVTKYQKEYFNLSYRFIIQGDRELLIVWHG